MGDKKEKILEWLESWREKHGIEGKLEGGILEQFVSEFQGEIVDVISDFGPTQEYEDAALVLYTGVSPADVDMFCQESQGKYYMINQTQLNFFLES